MTIIIYFISIGINNIRCEPITPAHTTDCTMSSFVTTVHTADNQAPSTITSVHNPDSQTLSTITPVHTTESFSKFKLHMQNKMLNFQCLYRIDIQYSCSVS